MKVSLELKEDTEVSRPYFMVDPTQNFSKQLV